MELEKGWQLLGMQGAQELSQRSQAEDQEAPPPPSPAPVAPTFTQGLLVPVTPARALSGAGRPWRQKPDRFMFRLQLPWPQAKSPVRHTHTLLSSAPGATQLVDAPPQRWWRQRALFTAALWGQPLLPHFTYQANVAQRRSDLLAVIQQVLLH